MTRQRDLSAIAAAVIAAAGSSDTAAEALRYHHRLPRCTCGHPLSEHRAHGEPKTGPNAVPPCTTASPKPCQCEGWAP